MSKRKILIQFDPDSSPSSFDSIVAIDAGVDILLPYGSVTVDDVEKLVHGCMFTRGPQDLHSTAIFVGGMDVRAGEAIASNIQKTFFGPMRVSVMLDSNGCNSTAAAAVLSAALHASLNGANCVVLGATGSVGRRVCRLVASRGGRVTVASRSLGRAQACCQELEATGVSRESFYALEMTPSNVEQAMAQAEIVFGCGAAGATLVSQEILDRAKSLKVAIDLNAVAPAGLGGIDILDKAKVRNGSMTYGALGVGGLKMKIHKAAIQQLFTRNDLYLDAEQMMQIGETLLATQS